MISFIVFGVISTNIIAAFLGLLIGAIGSALFAIYTRIKRRYLNLETDLQRNLEEISRTGSTGSDLSSMKSQVELESAVLSTMKALDTGRALKARWAVAVYLLMLLMVGVAVGIEVRHISVLLLIAGMLAAAGLAGVTFRWGASYPASLPRSNRIDPLPEELALETHRRMEVQVVTILVGEGWEVNAGGDLDLLAVKDGRQRYVEIIAKGQVDASDVREVSKRAAQQRSRQVTPEHDSETELWMVIPSGATAKSVAGLESVTTDERIYIYELTADSALRRVWSSSPGYAA